MVRPSAPATPALPAARRLPAFAAVLAVTAAMLALPATAQQAPATPAAAAGTAPAAPPVAFPATLAGHALLPARSLVPAPADAPADLRSSGKFTTGQRVEQIGSVEGTSAGRKTGVSLPFAGQPLQGHSGIKRMADGTFWVLTDNGAGAKANSPDFMLYLNHYRMDFQAGTIERLHTVFLHDPDKKVPFRIVQEGTAQRYLTGSDFDPESFQFAGGSLWIGDEFGPFLIQADLQGKVIAVFDTLVDGKPVRSPDHPAVLTPGAPDAAPAAAQRFDIKRSKGFEGMAASPDGSRLYALLEGPVWNADTKDYERIGGKEALRVLEFDTRAARWTGRSWRYPLEANGHAIGDFNMVDATTALVIERDNGEGTAARACPPGEKRGDCFHDLAKFKRVYKIEMTDANAGGAVRKIGYIDLMNIQDPQRRARTPLDGGVLTFPFFTIENVDVVDANHIVVGNDNNLPFSSSRSPNQADDNEMVLLEVGAFLRAP
ncbi:esterase-like activity of phytase family protein [uncultured Xylophilus sp.]|uniref:esterase-like activity of phytase family protein n=1 Tax=uncultured Xylophilus sp. TaxID=296832 RepID=UPI0025DB0661|nr:esterase-like activity of phytase family protein [uncultured Xylophilus sp.]